MKGPVFSPRSCWSTATGLSRRKEMPVRSTSTVERVVNKVVIDSYRSLYEEPYTSMRENKYVTCDIYKLLGIDTIRI